MKPTFKLLTALMLAPLGALHAADKSPSLDITGVTFRTADAKLQRLFEAAEAQAAANLKPFSPTMTILVEGAGYNAAWLETQPMGGAMYAKRNVEVALNNQLIFMAHQREDGRLPGSVQSFDEKRWANMMRDDGWLPGAIAVGQNGVLANFKTLQGHCFPQEALDVYFWAGGDRAFLEQLYAVLEKHDQYLWKVRDSNRDGCLEAWSMGDTGEDHCTKFGDSYHFWSFDFPPTPERVTSLQLAALKRQKVTWQPDSSADRKLESPMPVESMDIMSYSYANRRTLAAISKILGNGREAHWTGQAAKVSAKIKDHLWIPEKKACFDHDRNGKIIEILVHNNLRCMYFGSFDQEMADQFVRHHLLNPKKFWTPVPLPSIAANDPKFRNVPGNDWSGQSQGLTFQRAIRALENYGHYAELSLIGTKLLETIQQDKLIFGQQYDPFTGATKNRTGYGPTILSALEYISRMQGVHLNLINDQVWWSALEGEDFTYTQRWGDRTWTVTATKGRFTASIGDKEVFSCVRGVRVVTDLAGNVCEVVGIAPEPHSVVLQIAGVRHELTVKPNQVWRPDAAKPVLLRAAPFDYPYQENAK